MATFLSRICKTQITRVPWSSVQVVQRFYAFSGYRKRSRIKVCIIGADSAVGAPLAMLLQRSKLIDDIALYGNTRPERLAAELCCVPERPVIEAFGSDDGGLQCALKGSQLVLLAEGAFRTSLKREDHFQTHAKSACEYGKAIGKEVPNALVGVLTHPISAMLPVVWECVRRSGGRQPERRVMGVATLPSARVAAQAARVVKVDPTALKVYVGGGTCGTAAVPLLSALGPHQRLTQLEASAITTSIGTSGERIRRALKQSFGSIAPCTTYSGDTEDCGDCAFSGHTAIGMFMPTFSIAHAATKFVDAAVRAVSGHRCVETNAFVMSHVNKNYNVEFATVPVLLGRHGVLKILPLPAPTEGEAILLGEAKDSLRQDLTLAKNFLTLEFGPSERPTGISDKCPENDESGASIFHACREGFYPEPSPPCRTVNHPFGTPYDSSYFGEDDPCEDVYKRKAEK